MALYQVNAGDRILAADINQTYNLLKGVAASGEGITLIYNAAGVLILQPSSDPATGTELIQVKNNAGTVQSALSSDGLVYAGIGAVGLPAFTFELDKDTGIYRIAANTIGIAAGGAEKVRIDATGASIDAGVSYLPLLPPTYWSYNFEGKMTAEQTVTGTGVITLGTAFNTTTFQTGATSGSTSTIRQIITNAVLSGTNKCRRLEFIVLFGNATTQTAKVYLTDESATASPSDTARHIGIKVVDAVASFSTADGTTEQTTDVSASAGVGVAPKVFVVTYDGTTARLFINGTLRATHATNVPTAASADPVMRAFITNSSAADRVMTLSSFKTVFST